MSDAALSTSGNLVTSEAELDAFWKRIPASTGLTVGILFCVAYVLLIRALAPYLEPVAFAPDTGFAHYYWKLTDPTVWTRATAWGGYILHQVSLWALIYYAQERANKYSDKLHPVNIVALMVNAVFVLLHLLQTHLFYAVSYTHLTLPTKA